MPYDPPIYKPGDPIRASEVNSENEAILRLGRLRPAPGATARQGPSGPQIVVSTPEEIDIRLTGPCNAAGGYPWVQVYPAPLGTWLASERTGSLAVDPAYERRRLDKTLGAGNTVYRARRAPTTGEWLFAHRRKKADRLFQFKPFSCASLSTGPAFQLIYLPGARVVISQGGTVLSDSLSDPAVLNGFCRVMVDSSIPVSVVASSWRYVDFAATYPAGTFPSTQPGTMHPLPGYDLNAAGVRYPAKDTLRVSDPYTTIDLVGTAQEPESFYGCGKIWRGSYVRTVPVYGGGSAPVTFTWAWDRQFFGISYRHVGQFTVRDGQVHTDMTAVADSDPSGSGSFAGADMGLPQGDHMDVYPTMTLDQSGTINLRYGSDPNPGTYLNGTVRLWEP